METNELIVEAVSSKYDSAFKSGQTWYSPDKKKIDELKPQIVALKKGDKVEVDANGKWVQSITVISSGNATPPSSAPARSSGGSSQQSEDKMSKADWAEKDNRINRQNSSKTAFKFMGSFDMDSAEAAGLAKTLSKEIEKYTNTGEW